MSRVPPPEMPPLELDGIRYEQICYGRAEDRERRSGFMRACDIATGEALWELQVYKVIWEEMPLGLEHIDQDVFFIRFKFMPDKKRILIENEDRKRFFVDIAKREVREASDADFPPELLYQRKQPREIIPLVYRNILYKPDMDGVYGGRPDFCGNLEGYCTKTHTMLFSETIYTVPLNHDIENDQQECYFESMEFLPLYRDILIYNQAGDQYLFEIRTHKVSKFSGNRIEYHYAKLGMLNRIKYFFQDLWDNLTGKKY